MPRASKRKAAPPNSAVNPPLSDQTCTRSTTNKGKIRLKESDLIDRLFDSYENTSLGMIDPEGVETLCSDMKVGYADVRILMLAWKMKAKQQGYFTRDEWQTGLKALKANTILKLVKSLSTLQKEVEAPENFEDFYSFAFKYCLTEEKQKGVDIETIYELLKIVLGLQFRTQVDSLVEYLKITFPDLGDYDENQAWPLILDNFVDWMKKKTR